MKIEKITLYHVKLKLKNPFVTSFGEILWQESLLTKVESEGLEGWGEAPHLSLPLYCSEFLASGKILLAEHLLSRILGKNIISAESVSSIWSDLKGNQISKSAPEMAIWDLFSKANSLPLNQYLGAKRNTSPVGISIGMQKNNEEMLQQVAEAVNLGYKRIKIKIKPNQDIDVLSIIRNHYPNINIMADANSSYLLSDIDTLRKLDKFNLMMIEQPLSNDDIVDHATLQKEISTAICLDESIHSYEDAKKAISLGSCKIINLKPPRVGGISESLKIHELCVNNSIPMWIGGMLETGIGKAFLDHLSTLDGFLYPGDNSPQSRYYDEDIVVGGSTFENGIMTLSEDIGIGVTINEEMLSKHTVEKLVLTH